MMSEEGKNPAITVQDLPISFQVKYLGEKSHIYLDILSSFIGKIHNDVRYPF